MKFTALDLQEYIISNATESSILRAEDYDQLTKLVTINSTNFIFEVKGNVSKSYTVVISEAFDQLSTSCTCPYEGEGMCKHTVASLFQLIDMGDNIPDLKNTQNTTMEPVQSTKNKYDLLIPTVNGEMVTSEIAKLPFRDSGYYYYSPKITVENITKYLIELETYDYGSGYYFPKFKYDPKSSELILSCTCKVNLCKHKQNALELVLKRFSPSYFAPDYEDRLKNQFLQNNKLLDAIEFDAAFTLELTPNGYKVGELVSNIVKLDDDPFKSFSKYKRGAILPVPSKRKDKFGLGFCIEIHQGKIVDAYPFSGKMNKAATELSTKFREIDRTSLYEHLNHCQTAEEIQFLNDAIGFREFLEKYRYNDDLSIDELLKEGMILLNKMLPQLEKLPIILYNNKKSFVKQNIEELTFSKEDVIPICKITKGPVFYNVTGKLQIGTKSYVFNSSKIKLFPLFILFENKFIPITDVMRSLGISYFSSMTELNYIVDDEQKFITNIVEPFSEIFEIEFEGLKPVKNKKTKLEIEEHIYLTDEEGDYIVFEPLIKYGNQLVKPCSTQKVWANEDDKSNYIERNTEAEEAYLSFLQELHPNFEEQTHLFYLDPEEALTNFWLLEVISKLNDRGVKVFGLNNLGSIKYNLNKPTFSMNLTSGQDWFDMKIDVQFGDQTASLKDIQKSVLKKSNFVELADGTMGILPKEWVDKYTKYFKLGQIKKDKLEISNFQFNIIDELYEEASVKPDFLVEMYEKKKRLENLSNLTPVKVPTNVKAKLRDYQKDALNWLAFLDENCLGGCLADDMGLGKTLQTLTFLQYLKTKNKKIKSAPHLIVAPTSLIFNWLSEIEKFTPNLSALAFIGSNRDSLRDKIGEHDIVLTTYGSLLKDIEFQKDFDYQYIILDESQAIKNPQSQRYKAVRLLKGYNRLILTGTPIENNTFDLYAQFNFLNPGLLGSVKHFKTTFSDSIDKEQDVYSSELLARIIHPFILRRTKKQVATELPDKTESILWCEMGAEQRKVYDTFKEHYRLKLLKQIEEEGVSNAQVHILEGLTKLRQICNSTALADKKTDYGTSSIKLDELTRNIKSKVAQHKILIFSQFVGMLQLVKQRLEEEGILFEYLDGRTKNREERVDNFQNNDSIRVFLISLKAGGTGLNLTEADYVFLIDPWWNPAVENQAIDRCYRIGQKKNVFAYRMICKDTIEEKIVLLQDKKKAVADDVIRIDRESKSFNSEDVKLLFG